GSLDDPAQPSRSIETKSYRLSLLARPLSNSNSFYEAHRLARHHDTDLMGSCELFGSQRVIRVSQNYDMRAGSLGGRFANPAFHLEAVARCRRVLQDLSDRKQRRRSGSPVVQ